MARKKKKVKEQEVQATPSSVSYKGRVKIELRHGNTTYKTINKNNAGASNLFYFLAQCLAGNYIANNRPYFIALYNVSDSAVEEGTPILSAPTPASSITINNITGGEGWEVRYSFIIGQNILIGDTFNQLRLYGSTNAITPTINNFSAIIDLGTEGVEVDQTSNLVITWYLDLDNAMQGGN